MAFQPALLPFALAIQLEEHALRRGLFHRQGPGGRGRIGRCRNAVCGGRLRSRLRRPAHDQHEGHKHCKHSDPNHNAGLVSALQRASTQHQKHQSGHDEPIDQGQKHQPVRRVVCRNRDRNAVCLCIQDIVAGAAHSLLHGVGAAVQGNPHQAEHHIAACGQRQIHIHPAGIAHGGIGDHHALKAPLLPQHLSEQSIAGTGPGIAQIVIAAHDGGGTTLFYSQLEGLEVKLAHGLLVGPYRDGKPVTLLVIECKVFHIAIHALAGAALYHGSGQFAGKQTVLGVVFKVTATEGGAVNVCAGRIQTNHSVCSCLGREHLTEPFHQLCIPAGTDQHLAGEGNTLQIAGQAVQARRAIQIGGGGLAHAVHLRSGPATVGDHICHIRHAQLLQQQLPLGVVIVQAPHILQHKTMLAKGDGLGILQHGLGLTAEHSHGLGTGLLAILPRGGQRSLPIPTGYILRNLTAAHILKPVDRGLVVAGTGSVLSIHHGLLHGINTLVNLLVGVLHQTDLVVARFQHIAAAVLFVIGSHVFHGEFHRNGVGFTGFQQFGLSKPCQHHMGFFDSTHSIGGGIVHLNHILAGHGTGVGHLHFHADGLTVRRKVLDALLKFRIGQAITKGILHSLSICLFVTQAGGIVDPPGLIESVPHIDAFGIFHIVPLQIGIGKAARIPISRRRGKIVCIGIRQAPGRGHRAAQDLPHCLETGRAGTTDPKSRIHAILLHKSQFHGVGGIDQHDHPGKALRFHQFQQILLILGQFQIMGTVIGVAVARGIHVLRQVAALAAGAGEHDQRCVGKRLGVLQKLLVILGRRYLYRSKIGPHKALLAGSFHTGIFIKIHQFLVYLKPACSQSLDQIHIVRGIARTTSGSTVQWIYRSVSEQIHLCSLLQRQRTVFIFQQNDAFTCQLPSHLPAGLLGLLRA